MSYIAIKAVGSSVVRAAEAVGHEQLSLVAAEARAASS